MHRLQLGPACKAPKRILQRRCRAVRLAPTDADALLATAMRLRGPYHSSVCWHFYGRAGARKDARRRSPARIGRCDHPSRHTAGPQCVSPAAPGMAALRAQGTLTASLLGRTPAHCVPGRRRAFSSGVLAWRQPGCCSTTGTGIGVGSPAPPLCRLGCLVPRAHVLVSTRGPCPPA